MNGYVFLRQHYAFRLTGRPACVIQMHDVPVFERRGIEDRMALAHDGFVIIRCQRRIPEGFAAQPEHTSHGARCGKCLFDLRGEPWIHE